LEAEVPFGHGAVSQSMQVAPFDRGYNWNFDGQEIYDREVTYRNNYTGGMYQQSVSGVSRTNPQNYDGNGYATYGYELWSNPKARDEGYITWYSDGVPRHTVRPEALRPNPAVQIGQRLIPEEPMYLIMNLAMAPNFEEPDYVNLPLPATMRIDYVRIYQREDVREGVTCNPRNRPTTDYIERHIEAYSNPNVTRWPWAKFTETGENYTVPRNRLYDTC